MLMKIVAMITVLTIALGAGGLAVASAQSSVPLLSGEAVQAQTQTAAKTATQTQNKGEIKFMEALAAQTRTWAFELVTRAGNMAQVPFESRFGPAHLLDPEDDILPGKPWVDVVGNGGQEATQVGQMPKYGGEK